MVVEVKVKGVVVGVAGHRPGLRQSMEQVRMLGLGTTPLHSLTQQMYKLGGLCTRRESELTGIDQPLLIIPVQSQYTSRPVSVHAISTPLLLFESKFMDNESIVPCLRATIRHECEPEVPPGNARDLTLRHPSSRPARCDSLLSSPVHTRPGGPKHKSPHITQHRHRDLAHTYSSSLSSSLTSPCHHSHRLSRPTRHPSPGRRLH